MTARRSQGQDRRAGLAMALVVVVTVALTLMVHGALVLARTGRWLVEAEANRTEEGAALEAGLALLSASLDSLPSEGTRHIPGGLVRVHRPGPELGFLQARPTRAGAIQARRRIVFAVDPGTRVASRDVGFGAGRLRLLGEPPTWGAPCPEAPMPSVRLSVQPYPDSGPGLGAIPFALLRERLPDVGALDPWGRIVLADTVDGARALQGEIRLLSGSRFTGWLWVHGDLVVESGAELVGLADVSGRLVIEAGGRVQVSPCHALAALRTASSLRRPWRIGPAAW